MNVIQCTSRFVLRTFLSRTKLANEGCVSRMYVNCSTSQNTKTSSHLISTDNRLLRWNRPFDRHGFHTSSNNFDENKLSKSTAGDRLVMSQDKRVVTITASDGTKDRFNATWLRHHCRCHLCVHPVSAQQSIDPAALAPTYSIKRAQILDDCLVVACNEEEHRVTIPMLYLAQNSYSDEARRKRIQDKVPDMPKCNGEIPKVPYSAILESDRGVWQWVKHLNEEGMCLVQGIPPDSPPKQVIEKICPIQNTVYGETFATFQEEAVNISYTTYGLAPHMDMPYQECCPGYQFLLCERFDECVTGGESILVDAWYEAKRMQRLHPDDFRILTRVPVSFYNVNYAKDRVDMRFRGPHFMVDEESEEIIAISLSVLLQGPLLIPEKDIEPYYKAYHKYCQMLKNSESKVEFRLREGEMLGFSNRRLTHGRKVFKLNGGKRIFTGCYLNADEVRSRTQLLSNEFNGGRPVKFVFNRSSV